MKIGKTLILTESIAEFGIGLLWLGAGIFFFLDSMYFCKFTTGDGLGDSIYGCIGITAMVAGFIAVLYRLGVIIACIVATARKKNGGYIVASIMEFIDLGLLVLTSLIKWLGIAMLLAEFLDIFDSNAAFVLPALLICARIVIFVAWNILGTVFLSKGCKKVQEDRGRYGLG